MTPTRLEEKDTECPTREAILTATLGLLEEDGYQALTTSQIASRARVSKTTIYRFWSSKQELIVDAVRARFHPIEVPDLGSFKEETRFVLHRRLNDYRQPGSLRLVAGLVGAIPRDPILEDVFEGWVAQLSITLRKVIQRGIVRGDVRGDVDVNALEHLIGGIVARAVILQRTYPPTVVDQFATLAAAAVAP